MNGVQAKIKRRQKTRKRNQPILQREKNKFRLEYTALWWQSTGMRVLLMAHVLKLVLFRYFSGIEPKTMYPLQSWLTLRARAPGALLRKSGRTIPIRLIRSESTIASGAWPACQFVPHKQSRSISLTWNSTKKPQAHSMKLYLREVHLHHTHTRLHYFFSLIFVNFNARGLLTFYRLVM